MTDEATAKFRFDTRFREAMEAGATPEEAAESVLAEAPRDDLESVLFKWATNRARWINRRDVVNEERRIEATGATVAEVVASGAGRISSMMFYVDGEFVMWDQATAEQHEARAAMQRRLAGECIQDAVRHEDAARMIREAGVACLAQIGTAKGLAPPKTGARSRTHRRRQAAAA